MKRWLLIALTLLFGLAARAESSRALLDHIGFDRVAVLSEEIGGFDARSTVNGLMNGRLDFGKGSLQRLCRRLLNTARAELLGVLERLLPAVVAGLALRILLGKRAGAGKGALLICRLACISVFLTAFADARALASALIGRIAAIDDAVVPVLVSASALGGSIGVEGVLTPMTALSADIMERLIVALGLPLCTLAAIVAAAGNLSAAFPLNRLFQLIRRFVIWAMGLLTAGFAALLALEGMTGASQDTVASRVARRAVSSALPIIGGQVSGSLETLAGSVAVLKDAVGATGALLLFSACAQPVMRLLAMLLSARVASGVLEPAADPCMSRAAAQFAEVTEMLLALCAGSALLGLMLIAACLVMAGGLMR